MNPETSGDIPLYSLNKIRWLISRKPIDVNGEIMIMLLQILEEKNAEYKKESGNNWYCLTSNNLVRSIEKLEHSLKTVNDEALATIPKEQAAQAKILETVFERKRAEIIFAVKTWFATRSGELIYDMDEKIPWRVINRLRKNLSTWVLGKTNPFEENIEEMICNVAREAGYETDDPEYAWVAMGGTIFRRKG